MIVPWTTITEDESTWPPNGRTFCCGDGEAYRRVKDMYFAVGGSGNYFLERFNGEQWRPMPKPSKKKKGKIKIPAEQYRDMLIEAQNSRLWFESQRQVDYVIRNYEPIRKKSSWVSVLKRKPDSPRDVLVRNQYGNKSIGSYGKFSGEWYVLSGLFNCPTEWSEIPE